MSEKITMRVGESLVAGGPPGTAAEPEVIIGELDGPFGTAFAKWFFTTKIGIWVQQKFEQFMNYLQEKYDIELAKKEAAWRRDYPLLAERIDALEDDLDELYKKVNK